MNIKHRICYAEANYEEIVRKNGYFVDKTDYIRKMEYYKNVVFLRPRRFGKSLWCSILECYYDIRKKEQFETLFGHRSIGKNPTGDQNSCLILRLDFSVISVSDDIQEIEQSFNNQVNGTIKLLYKHNRAFFETIPTIDLKSNAADNLSNLCFDILGDEAPPLYVIIDEYDNFANQLVRSNSDALCRKLTDDNSFFKTFFKTLKSGRGDGSIYNVFITGVLPITMDDMASGFNVATYLTLDPDFEALLGFTDEEVNTLLEQIYNEQDLDPQTKPEVREVMRSQYDGYHFITPDRDGIYNSTSVMYFLDYFTQKKEITEYLTDLNLKTDLSWVRRITSSAESNTLELIEQLTIEEQIPFSPQHLSTKFNMNQFFEKSFYPVSFFYLGMFTRKDRTLMCLPNLNMRFIFTEYFNELHNTDLTSSFAGIYSHFARTADLPHLFAGYWKHYISQLPEAIFQKVNENFYRTTFYFLCTQNLSDLFTWNVERSYPQGKTDLEFVGKFHNIFAKLRYVIEFKYYSNARMTKEKIAIEDFQLIPKDAGQIEGYSTGLKQEYPEANIKKFVIYCFGNQGYRIFET